jgi:phage tail sheath protein FI
MWWLDHPTMGGHGTTASAVAGNDTAGNGLIVTDGTATFRAWGATADATGTQTSDTFENQSLPLTLSFQGGINGTGPSDADTVRAYDLMASAEDVDLSLVLCANHSSTVIRHVIDNIADHRKDCLAFFSPEKADVVGVTDSSTATDNIIDFRDTVNKNSSYAVMDSGYKYQFDKHNDKFRYVPLNGDTAGCCAQTDQQRDPFFSPAGFTRGQIKGVVKLPYNPKKAERDKLYQSQVNPVVSFPGEGTILFGDKTQLTKPSAFDRINVRRLFILLEKAIANAAKFQLFEFNDEFTRSQFVAMVEPFLRDIQGRGGIQDFSVVCDASNNTPQVVDTNAFRGDIFIKPSRAINFIQLNFVAVRSGVEFSEVVGAV